MATQKQVISWLEQIIPDVKSTRDPEGTMLKFARANNLAPAQLEKLAQVYNAAKTLNFLEKSADRGGKFHVVNAEDLVTKYASVAPAEVPAKQASDDVWFDKAASVHELERFPAPSVKSALAEEPVYSVAPDTARAQIREYLFEKEATRRNLEGHEQVVYSTRADAAEKLASVSERIRATPHVDFAAIERDVLFTDATAKEACDLVAAQLAKHMPVKRASDAGKKRLVQDPHGFVSDIVGLQELIGVAKSASALREEFLKSSGIAPSPVQPGVGPTPLPPQSPRQPRAGKRPSGGGGGAGAGGNGGLSVDGALNDLDLAGIVKSIEVPRYPGDPTGLVANLLADSLSRKNKGQEKVDREYDDLQAQTVVERLMYTDPIISQADPETVVSLANSIRSTAPDVARDINQMRAQLREMVQYGSMPTMNAKDLAGVQKTLDDSAATRSDVKKDRYGIGNTRTLG